MNGAHIHLIINHIPVVSIPLAVLFLSYAVISKHEPTQRFSLKVLMFCLLSTMAAYATGEPAEKTVEGLTAIHAQAIHPHAQAGKMAMYFSLASAFLAFVILKMKNPRKIAILIQVLIAMCIWSTGYLWYVAHLGGKIHHPEFEMTSTPARAGGEK